MSSRWVPPYMQVRSKVSPLFSVTSLPIRVVGWAQHPQFDDGANNGYVPLKGSSMRGT